MKKSYAIFMIALLMTAIGVSAQTAYVGLQSNTSDWVEGNGWDGCVVGFDITDPSTVTEVPFRVKNYEGDYGSESVLILSGTSAGDKYYAMCRSEYYSYSSFATLNFATGEQTDLGECNEYITDMAYDAVGDVLYGVESYLADGGDYQTTLYTINQGTGELTEAYIMEKLRIVAIASADEQKLYGVGIQAQEDYSEIAVLYLIDPKQKTNTLISTFGKVKTTYTYSLEKYEDNLYFVNGDQFITINPTEKTMTISENPLPRGELVGLTFVKSTANGIATEKPEPASPRHVRVVETWGDTMGDETGCTRREVTYYDADNNPMRTATYGKLLGKDEWPISRFKTYTYNDKKQLVQTSSEQYGMYDGEDMAFKASDDTISYEYDNNGRINRESTLNGGYIAYKYNEDGYLIEKTRYNPDRYDEHEGDYYVIESYAYSDFAAPDCPETIIGDGAYDSYKTLCKVTYDESKNKIAAKTYDTTGKTLRKAEYWTYEDGILKLYEEKGVKDGEEVDKLRTTYSFDNENPNRIKQVTENYSEGTWSGTPVYIVTEYANYDAMFSTELAIEPIADALNTVKLKFTVPNVPTMGGIAFDIYRHGIKVNRVSLTDEGAFDPATGMVSYVDKEVKNGVYDYFVQTVLLPEWEEDPEEAFNISNVVTQKIYMELPPVTNVHYISHKVENGVYVVTIGWDAPTEDISALDFQRYNVFISGFKMAENRDEDGQATTFDVRFGDTTLKSSKEKSIILQSVYRFGKVQTEPKVINLDAVAIENNEMDELIQFNGEKMVINSDNATVEIINMSGVVMDNHKNVKNVDLSTLNKGIYLVKIACAGKVYISKIVK